MSKNIRFAFFGTPELATVVLDELEEADLAPELVVTRPDAPKGRGKVLTPPPVKVWAEEKGVEVLQPKRIDDGFIRALEKRAPWDVFVVVAYGKILPKELIELPRRSTVNLHPSLLPRLRGPSPIRSAILTDERTTGVTIMLLDEEMDHGPILAQQVVEVSEWPPRASELEELLAHAGGQLLAETLPSWVEGTIAPQEQDHSQATYCVKLTKTDAAVSLSEDPYANLLKIRAYEGMPGSYMYFERNGKRIRTVITDAHLDTDGSLVIDRVIPEGKREMPYEDFARSGARPVA